LEITMTVPGAVRVIARLTKERPDILVGAGTVLDPETARICMLEGAQFVVSPALNLKTIEMCQRYSIAVLPGALTPTEVVTAWQAGADVIKVFPANAMGEFLEAGAFALGVGADLVDTKAMTAGEAHRITASARQYLEIVKSFRKGKAAA